jgi:predicted Fe-Mo cluster-binding NifX family protein
MVWDAGVSPAVAVEDGVSAKVGALPARTGRIFHMKVAIAQDGDEVSGHFGHCQHYILFTVENGKITHRVDLPNPGHEPGRLPALLAEHQVTHVVVGGMGPKAVDLFCANNIEVYLGIRGKIDTVINEFIAGRITSGESSCHHTHECGS